ncbi:class I adenylate-forming enzyme family protein [Actinokineospora globicatena]|uniref:class I adenylate-forming enzyme family protein n=1 Tax=Actinokineospora globicatena TaxID=103729 RepID=UPI0020A5E8F3|nr:class I adenylate-forming enzyme family protein [Actinokineospora globicatena]MCP2305664.1 Acyl-CoA synthetase (AMP-forming)/AMP-acid ligase II [Actinokineospora globicatena]GLW81534.1 ligase [Actinokineospora globicatena]GLW87768.1 ligase [Actinokineospora globicatena]
MTVKTTRAQLAADPDLGIGNVLSTLVRSGYGLDEPTLSFDTDVEGHPAWEALTLRQLEFLVAGRASVFHAKGIRPRDPVAIYVTASADLVLNYLALARIGAIPALVNKNLPGATAAVYITRVRPVAVLTDAAHRSALGDGVEGVELFIDVTELVNGDPAAAPEQYRHHADDPVVITHSSGTTGMPKAVVASHSSLFASVRHRLRLPRAQGVDRMLSALPANHAAIVIATSLALSNRSQLLCLSEQSGAKVLAAVDRWKPTCVLGFAATWPELVSEDLTAYDVSSVQFWWNTGDCAHEAHIRRLISVGTRTVVSAQGVSQVTGSAFIDGLGSTEMGHSQFFITHTPDTDRYGRCIGKPHAFADIAVLDDNGDKLPVGEVGQLGVRSPTLAPGYWNDSVTTYRSRLAGYFLTGDLAYRDAEGFYYHVDRAVDAIDLGEGKRLYTAQSEERVLATNPDVLDCTVVAVKDDSGQVVSAVLLTLNAGADTSVDRTEAVKAALPEYVAATIREVVVVNEDDIPRGATGKVRKVVLRQQHVDKLRAVTA